MTQYAEAVLLIAINCLFCYNKYSCGRQFVNLEKNKMDVNLILFKNNGERKTFSLPDNVTVIGRRHDCDLQIPLASVSRRHCKLHYDNGTLKIRDLNSHNGTFINGNRINETTVKAGDYLKIGPLTFLLQINGQPEKIVPPDHSEQKPPKEKGPAVKNVQDSDSFAELEFDDSDDSLTEPEDL